jgi:hypothetical protein
MAAHQDATTTVANLDDLEDAPAEDPRAPEDRPELAGLLAGEPYLVRARESGYVKYLNTDAVADAVAGGDADEAEAPKDSGSKIFNGFLTMPCGYLTSPC